MFKNKFQFWWVAVSLCLVTFLCRGTFTGFSAIINYVDQDIGFSQLTKSTLISLPTFIIAICSAFVDKLNERVGVALALFLSVVLIVFGLFFRDIISYGIFSVPFIFLGMSLVSLGVTIMSVLYPAFINAFFYKQMGIMSSINGTNLSISALAGTAAAFTMIGMGYSWRQAGLLWLIVSIAILVFYLPTLLITKERMKQVMLEDKNSKAQAALAGEKLPSMWKQLPAWGLALALGLEGFDFYFAFTWYPEIAKSFLSLDQINILITEYQVLSIPLSLLAPMILVKYADKVNKILFIFSTVFGVSAILLMLTSNFVLLVILFAIFGATSGILISSYMTLLSLKTTRSIATAKLSAMVQSVGFLSTAVLLFFMGYFPAAEAESIFPASTTMISYIVVINVLIPVFTLIATYFSINEKPSLKTSAFEVNEA